ncbi:putative TetR family transcriptional regulator [Gordonia araii NBRC 100433]|uniref:Putative TetR family transcriptional regulator n=1 Tax=Gordonia araii NBRC 100433 TaxID=1073574 RepID=G7H740_9ACTN|nr:TetR family transcriptional regulator [Gordonia araii]GAB11665.1 putative TetR family transcriptional regulator [Gordonia araii NBRC 100433]
MAAATPKGMARRQLLAEAAGALLMQHGQDAVRHRAVAERAGLPLASTTYYFNSLDDLLAAAVEYTCEVDAREMTDRCAALPERSRGARDTAAALAQVFVGDGSSERLAARYELFVLAARHPELASMINQRQHQVEKIAAEVLAKSARHSAPGGVHKLIAFENGALLESISVDAERRADPVGAITDAIVDVVDMFAPALADGGFASALGDDGLAGPPPLGRDSGH